MTLDRRDKYILHECRELAQEIALREEGLVELSTKTIGSPNMDGMPKGSGTHSASDSRLMQIEKYEHDLERDKRRLERLRRDARGAIKPLKVAQRVFYEEYFVQAQKAHVARLMAGISQRTMTNYLAEARIDKEIGP
jgi:hypothetical protein